MTFTCETCNYETKDKSNYNRHIKGKKHIKKTGGPSETPEPIPEGKTHTCDMCRYTTKRSVNYTRHLKSVAHMTRVKTLTKMTYEEVDEMYGDRLDDDVIELILFYHLQMREKVRRACLAEGRLRTTIIRSAKTIKAKFLKTMSFIEDPDVLHYRLLDMLTLYFGYN